MPLAATAARRFLLRRPWLVGLAVLGIAVGVASALAIDLANAAARQAFTAAVSAIGGQATHQVSGPPGGLPLTVLADLAARDLRPAPVVLADGEASGPAGRRNLTLFGVDPLAEMGLRPGVAAAVRGDLRGLLTVPGSVAVTDSTARALGVAVGDRIALRLGAVRHDLTVLAVIEAAPEAGLDALLLCDIATAQELTGRLDRVDRIDLRLDDRQAEAVRASLPPGCDLVPAAGRTGSAAAMTAAFHHNLTALGLVALVVGALLVHHTMSFAVVARQELFARLRACGLTPGMIVRTVLGEALLIGGVATALGLVAGVWLSGILAAPVARTVNDLYAPISLASVPVDPWRLLLAAALGLGTTLLAAVAPALSAGRIPPRQALGRSQWEDRARRADRVLAVGGLIALAGAAAVIQASSGIVGGFAGLGLGLAGAAALVPWLSGRIAEALRRLPGPVRWRLAIAGIAASPSRSGPAAAALAVALGASLGMTIMVGSFRAAVDRWLSATLADDVYVSAPRTVAARIGESPLPAAVVERLRAVAGVGAVVEVRHATVAGDRGDLPVVVRRSASDTSGRFQVIAGDISAWRQGGLIVTQPLANHWNLAVGDRLRLTAADGPVELPVIAVVVDYASDRGFAYIAGETWDRLWRDRAVTALGFTAAGCTPAELADRLRGAAGDAELAITAQAELRSRSLAVFDRTFAVTGAVRALALIVAGIAVLSAMAALGLERRRELALLRAHGATPAQVGGSVVASGAVLGLIAGLIAVPIGLALATLLAGVINARSFGWTMAVQVDGWAVLGTVGMAVVAAAVASLWPAWRIARLSPVEALHDE
jgi:putative ABC transport system permease protein